MVVQEELPGCTFTHQPSECLCSRQSVPKPLPLPSQNSPSTRCPLLVLITSSCLCLFGRCVFNSVYWRYKVMWHYVLAREFLNFYGRQTEKWSTMTQRITSPFFLLGHMPHCVLKLLKDILKKVNRILTLGLSDLVRIHHTGLGCICSQRILDFRNYNNDESMSCLKHSLLLILI